mmetsp:Transcript_15189/g.38920  ORF Transcript_15189/g.38920 Transcript_15189/m.38920 type:complete len:272 (-) Transcript_15189:727-1542(-)|eukprot:CAMPEP_0174911352 /NCGR_PEP_ID=MMETSP0167-20121228/76351_1 /TAXON_ID=38298 /ORGANISM="Rhodella maculata, Strain CCMP736" /LENGTH=271 /DNA_ID=CAMNT_0016155831 /DNA_START=253 /DNA_END=1068 /DNA_ORIENTATION=-
MLSRPSYTVLLLTAAAALYLAHQAAAQTTCLCEPVAATTCTSIEEDPANAGQCIQTTPACSPGCACTDAGTLLCAVVSANILRFNGTGNFCEVASVPVAACPLVDVVRQCCYSGTNAIFEACNVGSAPSSAAAVTIQLDEELSGQVSYDGSGPPGSTFLLTQTTEAETSQSELTSGNPPKLFGDARNITGAQTITTTIDDSTGTTVVVAQDGIIYNETQGPFSSGPIYDFFTQSPGQITWFNFVAVIISENKGTGQRSGVVDACITVTWSF